MRPTILRYGMMLLAVASFGNGAAATEPTILPNDYSTTLSEFNAAQARSKMTAREAAASGPVAAQPSTATSAPADQSSSDNVYEKMAAFKAAQLNAPKPQTSSLDTPQAAPSDFSQNMAAFKAAALKSADDAKHRAVETPTQSVASNHQMVPADHQARLEARKNSQFRCIQTGFFEKGTGECKVISKFSSIAGKLVNARVKIPKGLSKYAKRQPDLNQTSCSVKQRGKSLSETALCNPVEYGLQKNGEPWCVNRFVKDASPQCNAKAFAKGKRDSSLAWAMQIRQQFPHLKNEQEELRDQVCKNNEAKDKQRWSSNDVLKNGKQGQFDDIAKTCLALNQSGQQIAEAEKKPANTQVADNSKPGDTAASK